MDRELVEALMARLEKLEERDAAQDFALFGVRGHRETGLLQRFISFCDEWAEWREHVDEKLDTQATTLARYAGGLAVLAVAAPVLVHVLTS